MATLLEDLIFEYPERNTETRSDKENVRNSSWVHNSFLISKTNADITASKFLFLSTADYKFTDSSWGGNFTINSKPQWTPLSDPRRPGLWAGTKGYNERNVVKDISNTGMGDLYSTQYDDQQQRIYLRFGVIQFNDLASFVRKATDTNLTSLAFSATGTGVMYTIGEVVGTVAAFLTKPTVVVWILAGRVAGAIADDLLFSGNNQFYTIKSAQHLYWQAVQNMTNEFLVRSEFLPAVFVKSEYLKSSERSRSRVTTNNSTDEDTYSLDPRNSNWRLDEELLDGLAEMMPEIFTDKYGIDVIALASKSLRRSHQVLSEDNVTDSELERTDSVLRIINKITSERLKGYFPWYAPGLAVVTNGGQLAKLWRAAGDASYYQLGAIYDQVASYVTGQPADATPEDVRKEAVKNVATNKLKAFFNKDITIYTDPSSPQYDEGKAAALKSGLSDYMRAEWEYGMEFIGLDVNYTGELSTSFSNNVETSQAEEMLKGFSSTARNARFNLAGGNVSDNIISNTVEAAIGMSVEFLAGAVDGYTLGIGGAIADIIGGADIEMGQYWQDSSANLPTASYTIPLRSPYGNILSQMTNIWIPYFTILAGVLPISTGKASHGSPLYCQLYDRGRMQKSIAMITGFSASAGVGNTGYDKHGRPLGVDLTIDVTDLSPMLKASVSPLIDGDDNLSRFIATLAAQPIESMIHFKPRTMINMARRYKQASMLGSPAAWANFGAGWVKSGPITSVLAAPIAGLFLDESQTIINQAR